MRNTIVESNNVWLDYTNDEYQKKLLDLGLKGDYQNIPMPFINYDQYANKTNDWDVHWKSPIDCLRKENVFLILYHGRQEWEKATTYKNNEFTNKNTHHLIIGFSLFIEKFPKLKSKLVMIEYGGDVDNSKELIKELGISDKVVWMPKMYRKDLMYLIKNMDVCSGEFVKSYLTFGTVIEAMVMGIPAIHYREDNLYIDKYPELYPLYNAQYPEDISTQIERAWSNPDERLAMGKSAREWVIKYFIDRPLERLIGVLKG